MNRAADIFLGSDRQFVAVPGRAVTSANEKTAVIFSVGPVAIGLTVAEARAVAFQIGHAADEVEYQIARRKQR